MEKPWLAYKFYKWRVILASEKPNHGEEFPIPNQAVDKILGQMKILAEKVVGITSVPGREVHSINKEDYGMYLACLQPGDYDGVHKLSMCLTVYLANPQGDRTEIKSLRWDHGGPAELSAMVFVTNVNELTAEEFKSNVQPSEYDYIWVFEFPYRKYQGYKVHFIDKRELSDEEVQLPVASTNLIMRFWIDLREFRTGEKATKTPGWLWDDND